MNKFESKYKNTAVLMDESLLSLLEKKDFEYISVKEICQKAGVNRSTFYLHYETMDDLLNETIELIESRFYESFDNQKLDVKNVILTNQKDKMFLLTPEYLDKYLNFVKENKKVFNLAFSRPNLFRSEDYLNKLNKDLFKPFMDYLNINEMVKSFITDFYISGIMSIIKKWVKDDCKLTNEEVIKVIYYCGNLDDLKRKFDTK
jgi:AcrR family transcriptional regulator